MSTTQEFDAFKTAYFITAFNSAEQASLLGFPWSFERLQYFIVACFGLRADSETVNAANDAGLDLPSIYAEWDKEDGIRFSLWLFAQKIYQPYPSYPPTDWVLKSPDVLAAEIAAYVSSREEAGEPLAAILASRPELTPERLQPLIEKVSDFRIRAKLNQYSNLLRV